MAKDITISTSSDSGWVKVYVDGNKVLSSAGTVTISLNDGVHFLTYFVQGMPGNNYQIAITAPSDEAWEVKGSLKLTHTTGQYGITI